MTDRKPPKKSEMLEVRIPLPTKTAFMNKARAEGRPASEIVRDSIDLYLAGGSHPPSFAEKSIMFLRRHARPLLLLLAATMAATGIATAITPASARPDLRAAFTALDTNSDGLVSQDEFVQPQRALTTDFASPTPALDGPIAVAGQTGKADGAYVRFMLDTGASLSVLPFYVVVRVPADGLPGADFARLVGSTFATLDRNHDGRLTADEFQNG